MAKYIHYRIGAALAVAWGLLATGTTGLELKITETRAIDIHGFASQGYMKSDNNNFMANTSEGTFDFTEYGLNAGVDIVDQLRIGAQLYGRDLGTMGKYKPTLDWAVVDYRWQDWLGVRAGRIKMPYGLYNESRDLDMLRTGVFLPQSVYNESWRDAFASMNYGAGLYGYVPLSLAGSVNYEVQGGTLDFDEHGGLARYINSVFSVDTYDMQNDWAYLGRVMWNTPLDGFRLGYSRAVFNLIAKAETLNNPLWPMGPGAQADYEGTVQGNVLSAEYTWQDLVLSAEYMWAPLDYKINNDSLGTLLENDPTIQGYYGMGTYRFTDWFQVGLSYSVYYPNEKDKNGEGVAIMGQPEYNAWLKDAALTTRFDFWEYWTFKLEGHALDGGAVMFADDNMDSEGNYINARYWSMFIAKLTFNF